MADVTEPHEQLISDPAHNSDDKMLSMTSDKVRLLRLICRVSIILLAAAQLWAAVISQSMNEDGINYLDIADAYARLDWQTAVNPIWSPLYSWVLAPFLYLFKPSMRWEFPLVQFVNFTIFLGTFICFEFFWRQVLQNKETNIAKNSDQSLPEWAWVLLGYILFATASLYYIGIYAVTPDMLMAGLVYIAAGLVLRIRLGSSGWGTFILLGAVLGLSYLAKTVMFPISLVFLIIAMLSTSSLRQTLPKAAVGVLVFLSFSLPFILALSMSMGKVTIGEAGTLTYARYINGVSYPHWQGEPPGNGVPVHPSRQILDSPPIYEFGTPIGGTYPISLNPAYWYQGVTVHFDLQRQLDYLSFSLLFYIDLFFQQLAALVMGVFILYLFSRWQPVRPREIVVRWGLSIVALFAFASYALVNVLGRYVGVFVVLFWADILANIRLPRTMLATRMAKIISAAMILILAVNIASFNLERVRDLLGWGNPHQAALSGTVAPSWPGEVAESLYSFGLEAGDKVGVIGYAFSSYWARLARVQIVAEMLGHDAEGFYLGDPHVRSRVLQAFANAGVQAVVAEDVPSFAVLDGWHQVGRSNYYIYLLKSQP